MHLEFKFSNDVNASVCIATKTIYQYTIGIDGEMYPFSGPIEFKNDNDMIRALNDIANRVNLNQHRDIVELIFDEYKDCDDIVNTGELIIIKSPISVHQYNDRFVFEIESLGALYVLRKNSAMIINKGVCIATIN